MSTTTTTTQTAIVQTPTKSSSVRQSPNPNPDGGPKSQKQMSKLNVANYKNVNEPPRPLQRHLDQVLLLPSQARHLREQPAKGATQSPASAAKKSGKTSDGKLDSSSQTFKITGANARCIAMLTAFKAVIQDYVTPPNNTLSRHLMTHLSPQINHLVLARPFGSDIDLPEQDAKNALCTKIDNYIRDRIVIADQVIQETAGKKIKDGDVILTYARSSVVEKVLLRAWEDGKRFSAILVDSRPMLEGKALLKALTAASIPCTYLLLPSLPSVLPHATTLFVATVAMMAKMHNVPVVVCCETYKWSETVRWDSFSKNELAPAPFPSSASSNCHSSRHNPDIKTSQNLSVLCPLYDLTPPSYITAVVTEVGVIPPSSMSSIPAALGRTIGA
ncbi:eukaryotic translation initiation factor 2B delta subunit [Pisolithus thermaeus]|nr:eukaryotic translation initiation factor 2B delta subunit [Pisolithus thermaeus]